MARVCSTSEEAQGFLEEMVKEGWLYCVTTGDEEPRYWPTPAGWDMTASGKPYPGVPSPGQWLAHGQMVCVVFGFHPRTGARLARR